MKRWICAIVVGALGMSLVPVATARPQTAAQLAVGAPVEREIKGGETHVYAVSLEAGQYVDLLVMQRGANVHVALFGPDGAEVESVDNPTGPLGREAIHAVVQATGTYRCDVKVLDASARPGRYDVTLVARRAATAEDRMVVDAERLWDESYKLWGERKLAEAAAASDKALAMSERGLGAESPDLADYLNVLGDLYREQTVAEEYAKARPLLERALAIKEKALGPDHPDLVFTLNSLANLHDHYGEYKQGELRYAHMLAIREKVLGPEHADVASSYNDLGISNLYQGQFTKAEAFLTKAVEVAEKALGPDHLEVASYLKSLAQNCHYLGQLAKAEPLLVRSLAIREKALGPDHKLVGESLSNLARIYAALADVDRAEVLLLRALAIYEKTLGPDHRDTAIAVGSLGDVYYRKRDYVKAEPYYARSVSINEKLLGPDHSITGKAYNNLALVYMATLDFAKAAPLFERSLSIAEKTLGIDHNEVGTACSNLGRTYTGLGEYAKAEAVLARALTIWDRRFGPDHPLTAVILGNQANLKQAQGDFAGALDAQSRANDTREKDITRNILTGSQQRKLAYLRQTDDDTSKTINLQALLAPTDTRARRVALEQVLRRKGRALDAMADILGLLGRTGSAEDQKLLADLASARAALSSLTLAGRGSKEPEAHRAALAEAERRVADVEAAASARGARLRVALTPITFDAVAKAVPKGSVLVEFSAYRPIEPKARTMGDARYVVYTLSDSGAVGWADLGPTAKVDAAVAALRQALADATSFPEHEIRARARALDELVMRPVRSLAGTSTRLLVAPDGALNLVPFAALVDEHDRYLVERFELSYLTSGRDLLRLRERDASQHAPLVMAAPDFGPSPAGSTDVRRIGLAGDKPAEQGDLLAKAYFPPLAGTEVEASALSKLLPQARVLTGAGATKAALVGAPSPRLLHVATHGFFFDVADQNPLLRSGLALAGANLHKDGETILTAEEVAGLDLWGTQLVVLSACDTGLGEIKSGDGVYGLRRALVLAGAETQVMSLWTVSDTGTRDLMIGYYRALMAGKGRSEALREVQLGMLKDRKRRNPYFWASFIVSGAWEPLTTQNRSR